MSIPTTHTVNNGNPKWFPVLGLSNALANMITIPCIKQGLNAIPC